MEKRLIILAGIDGTGKSTISNSLIKELHARNIPTRYVWMRMNYFFSRPFLLICRITGLTKRPTINGQKISVHEFYRFRPMAKLIQYTHFIDTTMKWLKEIYWPMKVKNQVVVCDRFVHDILIDFAIEAREWDIFSRKIAQIFKWLILQNAFLFLVRVERDKILERKTDVVDLDDYFEERYNMYDQLKSDPAFCVIENNGTIQQALQKIITVLKLTPVK